MIKKIYSAGCCPASLNFGCGSDIKKGWFNIDAHINETLVNMIGKGWNTWIYEGIVKSPHSLPYNHFEEVYSRMCFEHIHPDMIPNTLYCLYHSMKPGGEIKIIVPNFVKLAESLVSLEPTNEFDYFRELRNITNEFLDPTFEDEGFLHGHQSIWTPKFAEVMLSNEGFHDIRIHEYGKNNYYLQITANKPENNPFGSPNK